jgi:chromosome segregation ATPase
MESELDRDFEALVRKSGTVFVTNVGNGPEEMVLAIATPTLKKTQVATQADLVAAGYVRVDGMKRAETDRDRLKEALARAEQLLATAYQESSARHQVLIEENEALKGRVQQLEAARTAEQEGIAARNENEPVASNPYLAGDEAQQGARHAWAHGWKLRDVLISQSNRVKGQEEQLRGLEERRAALEVQAQGLMRDKAALQSHVQAVQAERQSLLLQLQDRETLRVDLEARLAAVTRQAAQQDESAHIVREEVGRLESERSALLERYTLQSSRLQKIQAAYQRLLLEAPHSSICSRVTGENGGGCDCWLLKYGYAALESR